MNFKVDQEQMLGDLKGLLSIASTNGDAGTIDEMTPLGKNINDAIDYMLLLESVLALKLRIWTAAAALLIWERERKWSVCLCILIQSRLVKAGVLTLLTGLWLMEKFMAEAPMMTRGRPWWHCMP